MKTINDVYVTRNRGPWNVPKSLQSVIGVRESRILNSTTCEVFPHKLNKDCDFYLSDDCTTYYCPASGMFTIQGNSKIVN